MDLEGEGSWPSAERVWKAEPQQMPLRLYRSGRTVIIHSDSSRSTRMKRRRQRSDHGRGEDSIRQDQKVITGLRAMAICPLRLSMSVAWTSDSFVCSSSFSNLNRLVAIASCLTRITRPSFNSSTSISVRHQVIFKSVTPLWSARWSRLLGQSDCRLFPTLEKACYN